VARTACAALDHRGSGGGGHRNDGVHRAEHP
jgi:hypothetical protein